MSALEPIRRYLALNVGVTKSSAEGRFTLPAPLYLLAEAVRSIEKQRHLLPRNPDLFQKNHPIAGPLDVERIADDLCSTDDRTRAKAVSQLCPCRAGFAPFEQNLDVLARLCKDPSPLVRASALHVFEDAGEMQNEGYPTSSRENTNEMLRQRRASRFRPDASGEAASQKARSGSRHQRIKKVTWNPAREYFA